VEDADFLILFPPVLPPAVLRAAQGVKLIQLVSAGFDALDVGVCREMGIPVANNGGTNSIDVAEHTLTLILAWYRRLGEMDANVRTGAWSAIDSGVHTYTIHGKTVGLVGLGNIGRKVARLLRAFGATVIYTDAYPAPAEIEAELGVTRVEMDELLARADVVSLHTPLNDATRGLIGRGELAKMQPSALLVNTCRGPVVDEAALIAALQGGQIAGAALDVLEKEPPVADNPLLTMANVLLTPHSAGVTRDTWARRGEFVFANLQRVWAGQPPLARIA
jgi:phosphoglycerate dehydrogenase-like enzyme